MGAKSKKSIPPCPTVEYVDAGFTFSDDKQTFIGYVGSAMIGSIQIWENSAAMVRCDVVARFGEYCMSRTEHDYNDGVESGKRYIEEKWQATWAEYHTPPKKRG